MIKQHPLIILSPAKKDKLEELDKRLTVIRENLQQGTESEFKKVPTLHYGRWVILTRESFRDEPAVPVGTRLIFSTNFDGDKDNHLTELVTQLTKYIDDIYECCDGYPEQGARTTESRKNYLEKYSIKTSAFYNGAPGRSVGQIHQEACLREYIWNFIKESKWDEKAKAVEIHRAIRKEVDSRPEFEWSKQKAEVQGIKWLNLFGYGLLLIAAIPLIIIGALYLFLFHELWNKKQTLTLSQLDDKKVNELKNVEDLFPQNQFTQVAVLKPNFIRRLNFQIWMLRTRVLANNVFVHGKLLNIPTIHFARWVLFDNNKHVLFFSNFDGNWQQYLGDFIDQSGWGLTGIFSNTVNFPKTKFMITGGAYDEEHFLAWSRSTQVPTQVWYCPYPQLSIKNINNNTKIRNELRKDLNEQQAKVFLKKILIYTMTPLELSEIQAFLFNDYKEMGSSKYYLMQVKDVTAAKKFLASVADSITNANTAINETCLNIGFTSKGLIALGYSNEENLHSFSREFREGMVSPHRQRLLGDFDSSDPAKWQWGGPANDRVDMILMVFGKNESIVENYFQSLKQKFEPGFSVIHILNGKSLPNDREHFGFRDGISQPVIKGSKVAPAGNNNDIDAGEFVLGYKNEYGIYPDAPLLKVPQGDQELLTDNPDSFVDENTGKPFKDIGRNGTYFVLRQLEQNVDGFWNFLKKQAIDEHGNTINEEATKIAAKMFGRWPSGAPLVTHPERDPGGNSDDNSFRYIKKDKDGEKCPFGSHIRRTNPRDHFEESPPGVSLKLTRRHRIMRRVRSYGEDFIGSAENHRPNGEVGLLFGCFNANISKQFEFIQYTWANSPKFKKLYDDPDPIIGVRECPAAGAKQNFTIPQKTVNKVIPGLQSFVTVKGGAYFFFPSVTVLKFLATI